MNSICFPKLRQDSRQGFTPDCSMLCYRLPAVVQTFRFMKDGHSRFCKWRDEETLLKKDGNAITISTRKDILWNVFSITLNSSAE